MLARCARVEPASVRAWPGSAYLTSRRFSACTTLTPAPSAILREPFAPFSVTALPAIVAVTPCGRSTGALAILDMVVSPLRHDAEHFAALADRARLLVGHDALRCGDDHRPHAAKNLRQLVLAAIDAQPRTADTLQAVDDRAALEVLEADGQSRLAALLIEAVVGDVAFVLQHLDDGRLQLRGGEANLGLARGLAVADSCQEVGDRIGHAHRASLTSSPSTGPGSRRGWRPRGSSPAKGRTCGRHRGSVP